jgi:MFS family permease
MFLAPVGGALADRISKRRLLTALQVTLALQAVTLAIVAFLGWMSIGHILVLAAVFGLASAAEMPIRLSLLSEVVPRSDLPNAIVLHQAAFSTTRLLAPAVAGLLVVTIGFSMTLAVAAALAVLAVGLLQLLDATAITRTAGSATPAFGRALREGIVYGWSAAPVRNILLVVMGLGACGASIQAILPLVAVDVLRMEDWSYGILLSALGTGGLVAAAPMSVISPRSVRRVIWLALLCFATALAGLTLTGSLVVAAVLLMVIGFCQMAINGSANMALQFLVSDAMRGRVLGLYIAIWSAGLAAGSILVSVVAYFTDARTGLLGCAVGTLCVGLWAFTRVRVPTMPIGESTS